MHVESIKHGDGLRWIVLNDDGTRYAVHIDAVYSKGLRISDAGIRDVFDTEAFAKNVMHEAQDYQRFTALREWMQGCGCHATCATLLSFARVEIERGRMGKEAAPSCDFCPAEAPEMNCADTVRARWKMAPGGRLENLAKKAEEKAA